MVSSVTALPGAGPAKEPRPAVRKSIAAALRSSLRSMPGLTVADEAVIALAMAYARRLDESIESRTRGLPEDADQDAAARIAQLEAEVASDKLLGWLGPHLGNVLRDLGGTPAARARAKTPAKKATSALQEARAGRAARAAR